MRAVLKMSRVGESRMSLGREFQRVGAAMLKALSPKVLRSVLGVARRPVPVDLSLLRVAGWWRRSERYWGARPWWDL